MFCIGYKVTPIENDVLFYKKCETFFFISETGSLLKTSQSYPFIFSIYNNISCSFLSKDIWKGYLSSISISHEYRNFSSTNNHRIDHEIEC